MYVFVFERIAYLYLPIPTTVLHLMDDNLAGALVQLPATLPDRAEFLTEQPCEETKPELVCELDEHVRHNQGSF